MLLIIEISFMTEEINDMGEYDFEVQMLLERGDISYCTELMKKGVNPKEIVSSDGANIVNGSLCCNVGCKDRLSLLKTVASLVDKATFAEMLRQPILVLTPNQADKLIARGIEITPEVEKKYSKKHTALELSAQYHSFEFLKDLIEYLTKEKHIVLSAEEKSSIRRIALSRDVFCTEEEIEAILNA